MKRTKLIIIATSMLIVGKTFSQQLELGFGTGSHFSKFKFHHTSMVDTDDDSKYQSHGNSNFKIRATVPIYKGSWFLQSEIGFLKTNSFFAISYKYDEGFGVQNITRVSYLTNQKLYLSISPEYRINLYPVFIKIGGGLLFTSDVSNTMSTSNTVLLPKSNPMGFKIETGIQYLKNKIGAELNLSYVNIGKSELFNIWHPKISYNLIVPSFGIVYKINEKNSQ